MANLNERLKELRKKSNITQVGMSKILECTEQHYQKIEYGKIDLSSAKIIFLAHYFNVSTDYLLGCSDDPTRQ